MKQELNNVFEYVNELIIKNLLTYTTFHRILRELNDIFKDFNFKLQQFDLKYAKIFNIIIYRYDLPISIICFNIDYTIKLIDTNFNGIDLEPYLVSDSSKVLRKSNEKIIKEHNLLTELNIPYDNKLTKNEKLALLEAKMNSIYEEEELSKNNNIVKKDKFIILEVNQYDINGNFIKKYDNHHDAEKEYNLSVQCIIRCCNGYTKTAGKFIWKFVNESDRKKKQQIYIIDQFDKEGNFIKRHNNHLEMCKELNITVGSFINYLSNTKNCKFIKKYRFIKVK